MKLLLPVIIAGLLLGFFPSPVMAQSAPAAAAPAQAAPASYDSDSLCLPDAYLQTPGDCQPLGPSAYLTRMAQEGIRLPLRKLPTQPADPALSLMSDRYIVVTDNSIPLYSSLADAAGHAAGSSLDPGMKYLAINQRVEQDGAIYYQLTSGWWVEGGEAGAGCCIVAGRYQGLLFSETPRNSFGWIADQTVSRRAPGYAAPETGKVYYRENVVQVYQVVEADKTAWYRINMEEWVEKRYIRVVQINTTPPAGVSGERWIEVNLGDQTLSVYDNRRLVFATMIASGMPPFYTRPGAFQIYKKKPLETMSGAFEADRSDYYYLENVPWTMYYDEARALHGAYWRTVFGYPQSHGCVNLSPGDSNWLYQWAKEGDWVYVWDPTGATPTDPKYYGPGGA